MQETLYELTEQFLTLLEMAADPSVPEDVLKDTMEAVEADIKAKADGYAKIIKELQMRLDAIGKEIDRLQLLYNSIGANIKRLKRDLYESMVITGNTKFKTTLFSFWIQANTPSLVIDRPEEVPEEFMIPQPPKLNNESIKKMLKDGKELSYAHLERTETVRFR